MGIVYWYWTCVAVISPSPLPLLFFCPQAATGRWIPPNPSLYNYNRVVQEAASFLSSLVYVVSVCGCVWELSCVCDCVRPWLDALKEVKRYTRKQAKASEMEFFKKKLNEREKHAKWAEGEMRKWKATLNQAPFNQLTNNGGHKDKKPERGSCWLSKAAKVTDLWLAEVERSQPCLSQAPGNRDYTGKAVSRQVMNSSGCFSPNLYMRTGCACLPFISALKDRSTFTCTAFKIPIH